MTSDEVDSGDLIFTLSLNGLDEMQLWLGGGVVGHSTFALRAPNNTLFVCETTDEPTWPYVGCQCNPFDTWIGVQLNKILL